MPTVSKDDNSTDLLLSYIQSAIDAAIKELAENMLEQSVSDFRFKLEEKLNEMLSAARAAAVVLKIMKRVSYETMGNELIIKVEMPRGGDEDA
jgi:vacuolar-type H+-ATPase subunit E/Vma4